MKIALVEWWDAAATDPTVALNEEGLQTITPLLMKEVGFLQEYEDYIVLYSNVSEEGMHRRMIAIPKGMIVKIKRIKV